MAIRWAEYEFRIRFREPVVGGVPVVDPSTDPAALIESWARGQGVPAEDAEKLAADVAEDPDLPVAAEPMSAPRTSFKSDERGVYLEARQVKALIKEASSRLGYIRSTKGMKQVVQHDVHVRSAEDARSQKLYLERAEVQSSTRAISVVTRLGPRTAIKSFDYSEAGTELAFVVRILRGGLAHGVSTLDEERLVHVMTLAEELGLGADRSQGAGTFDVVHFAYRGEVTDDLRDRLAAQVPAPS